MRHFLVLFKHEFRMQFPRKRKGRTDIMGNALSWMITILILGVFVYLLSTIVDNYITISIYDEMLDMIVNNPVARAVELLNVIYSVIIIALTVMMLEKMRATLARQQDKTLFLRMPVKQQTIFLSKLATLLISNYLTAFLLIFPINLIFYFSLDPGYIYWIYTTVIWLLLPMVAFLIASILLVPYIKIVDFVSNKYGILFILFSVALVGAFLIYAEVLEIIQNLLETGSIKFLFNSEFIDTMQLLIGVCYPANLFAYMAVGSYMGEGLLINGALALIAVFTVYFVSKTLYYITLYKNESQKKVRRKKKAHFKAGKLSALMRKEFISVFREPQNLFSYFAIATAMPIMVYSCYTLFESLVYNALGMNISFALALVVVLIFSILTNTFCATNVSRDGELALKVKMFPVRSSKILLAKVLFCSIVSSLSVIASTALLFISESISTVREQLEFTKGEPLGQYLSDSFAIIKEQLTTNRNDDLLYDMLIITVIGVVFSLSQIFVATRLDLNHAKVMASAQEIESESNKTIAKTIFIGLILAILSGASALVVTIFEGNDYLDQYIEQFNAFLNTHLGATFGEINIAIELLPEYLYYFPLAIVAAYFVFSVIYYAFLIEHRYRKLVR